MSSTIWVVSELYYPEQSATGYFLTNIAEGLSLRHTVNVFCAQPTYSARGTRAPFREIYHGVEIFRCWSTTFDKDILFGRIVNLVTLSVSVFLMALRRFGSTDRVIVVTNPPSLPFAISAACWLRGAEKVLLIHDVYPEVLVAASMWRRNSAIVRILDWLNKRLLRGMDWIIVLGRDMKGLVISKLRQQDRVSIIPNWGDIDQIVPVPKGETRLVKELELTNKFIVQYSGNIGRTHGLESLVGAAEVLRNKDEIHFLFIGSGAKKPWLEKIVQERALANVTVLPMQPRKDLCQSLNACDVAVISFVPGMAGVSVPSRMYNILAAGKPIIAVADNDSELALVVREESVGWVVPPNEEGALSEAILEARNNAEIRKEMGDRARRVATEKYSKETVINAYLELMERIDAKTV
jgi:glycosyltransferase involved in cell wall biosynthesis